MFSLLQGVTLNGKNMNLRGKIKLIYIDRPFKTGADFSFKVPMPNSWRDFIPINKIVKNPSITEDLHIGTCGMEKRLKRESHLTSNTCMKGLC